jgi:hypothetical protein
MSLQTTPSDRKPPARQRLSAKLTAALDAMVWDGLTMVQAARKVNLSAVAMRQALSKSHVIGYLNREKQVFRATLSTGALTRMAELSQQNDNLTAAVAATRTLLNESDQEHSPGQRQALPGLVVQIINSPAASHALPSVRTIEHDAQDVPAAQRYPDK